MRNAMHAGAPELDHTELHVRELKPDSSDLWCWSHSPNGGRLVLDRLRIRCGHPYMCDIFPFAAHCPLGPRLQASPTLNPDRGKGEQ